MLDTLERSWKKLKASDPGCRFQDRYQRKHEDGEGKTKRVLTLGAGIVVFLAGLFFLPAPGPGFIVVAIGAGIIAQESRRAARWLDQGELKLRAAWRWGKGWWEGASVALKAVVVTVAAGLGAATAWVAWTVLVA